MTVCAPVSWLYAEGRLVAFRFSQSGCARTTLPFRIAASGKGLAASGKIISMA